MDSRFHWNDTLRLMGNDRTAGRSRANFPMNIDPLTVSMRHLQQLVALVQSTGYFQYVLLNNKHQLTVDEAIRIHKVGLL